MPEEQITHEPFRLVHDPSSDVLCQEPPIRGGRGSIDGGLGPRRRELLARRQDPEQLGLQGLHLHLAVLYFSKLFVDPHGGSLLAQSVILRPFQ